MIIPNMIDRRTYIQGLTLGAGAVVLQPFLNSLEAQANGEKPQPRLIFVMESNGLYPHHVQPVGVNNNGKIDQSLIDLELPEAISPLNPMKKKMCIIQKLSHKVSGGGDHGKGFGGLGCFQWRKGVAGQTIDHAFSDTIKGIIPVLGLAVPPNGDSVFTSSVSAIGPKKPLSMICQPNVAFQTLFGSVAQGDAGKVYNAKNKLLDHIRDDIRKVRNSLPSMDRDKLDSYLDAFDQIRTRQEEILKIKEELKQNQPITDKFDSKLNTHRFESQCAIAACAIAGGLTNVVTLDAAGGIGSYHTWKSLGVDIDGHAIGHMNGPDNLSVPIRKYHAERVLDIANRLDSIKEGDGTMLDNSLIVWMSDSGEGHHGFCGEWPIVLIGNLGGRLKTDGRFLQYPAYGSAGNRTIRNFYLSLLHAVGDNREKFGELDLEMAASEQSGPLTEIL